MAGASCSTRALVALGIAAVAVGFAPAQASESLGVVAVSAPPGPAPALLDMTEQLRQRIAERHEGALGPSQLLERIAPPTSEALSALERALDQARQAYLEGDVERTLRMLRQVAEALERHPGGDPVQALWARALLRTARTELDVGRRDAARATLERLLRGAPDLSVDPLLVPARLVEELESVRAALRALPARTLVVASSDPRASIFVNGRALGAPPVRLELPVGRCRVAATTERSQVGPFEAEVGDKGQEILLDFAALESLREGSGRGLALAAEERPRRLLALGEQLGLDRVVGVAADGASEYVLASVLDVRRGVLEREARLRLVGGAFPAGGEAALADFIVRGRTDSPLVLLPGMEVRAPTVPVSVEAPSSAASQALRWAPVATAAAVVGFAAAAVFQGRAAQDAYDRATQYRADQGLATFRSVATYNGYVSEGDAAKQRAAGYWVGAGLCAAATAVLGYWSYRRTGEVGPVRF
jgi:hypothetical protein